MRLLGHCLLKKRLTLYYFVGLVVMVCSFLAHSLGGNVSVLLEIFFFVLCCDYWTYTS
jgi:hypothetical protein